MILYCRRGEGRDGLARRAGIFYVAGGDDLAYIFRCPSDYELGFFRNLPILGGLQSLLLGCFGAELSCKSQSIVKTMLFSAWRCRKLCMNFETDFRHIVVRHKDMEFPRAEVCPGFPRARAE